MRALASTTLLAISLALAPGTWAFDTGWPGWGGPNGDFTVKTKGLARSWPSEGPKRLWHRELGTGYSGIVTDGAVLYTMYRTSAIADEEITIALDAKTGKTKWEHRYPVPTPPNAADAWGPNSTPLIVGDRLYTIGSQAVMHAFNRKTGEVLWKHDLAAEFGVSHFPNGGYSVSPTAYRDTVIVVVGRASSSEPGAGQSAVAFDRRTGRVVWKTLEFHFTNSTPILAKLQGLDQLIIPARTEHFAIDPTNGKLLWSHPVKSNITSPLRVDDRHVLVGDSDSGYMLGIGKQEQRLVAELEWSRDNVPHHVATPVLVDGIVVGSTGAGVMAIDPATGDELWSVEGPKSAWCVMADDKAVLLDQDGELSIATVTRQGLEIHSQHRIAETFSMTPPSLVGTNLYVRDYKHIMAIDLGTTSTTR